MPPPRRPWTCRNSRLKIGFDLMDLCFENMYESFGEFCSMEIGLSSDYFGYSPECTIEHRIVRYFR